MRSAKAAIAPDLLLPGRSRRLRQAHQRAPRRRSTPASSPLGPAAGHETTEVEIAMQWNAGYIGSVHTFANTINTHEGGTHEEGFRSALTTVVNKYAKDKKLLKEQGRQPDRRGHPRRPGRRRLGQGRRAAVRGPDEDQAGQHRGEVLRPEGLQRAAHRSGWSATPPRPRPSSTRRCRPRTPDWPRRKGGRSAARARSSSADCPASSPTAARPIPDVRTLCRGR